MGQQAAWTVVDLAEAERDRPGCPSPALRPGAAYARTISVRIAASDAAASRAKWRRITAPPLLV
jgi:hypothetical protein